MSRLLPGMCFLFMLLAATFCSKVLRAQAPYETAQRGYLYKFPRDHFDHPAYQTEWWYYTGNVTAEDGHRFGFELTFFRQAASRDADQNNTWDVRDLYLAHAALSDLDGGKFYHAERLTRRGPEIAGVSEASQRMWNGNWRVSWNHEDQQLEAIDKKFALNLKLHPEKPPAIQGENGISQKSSGAGHASHYISLTRIATNGAIAVNGQRYRVAGLTWMDHEFFSGAMDAAQQGWDWLAIQLADHTELMLYQFRRRDGSRDPYSSGTYIDAQGKTMHLRAADFTLTPSGTTWKSPATHATYPISWKIQISKLNISLDVKTVLPSQELAAPSNLSPNYWEGAITASGTRQDQPISGVGYLELTGYDHAIQLPQ